MEKKNGFFLTHDNYNNPIILEWETIGGQTNRLSEKIKSVSDVLVPAYAQTEVEFAYKTPQDVPGDFMLTSLAPLLEQGTDKVDKNLFLQKTEDLLSQFFITMDWAKSSEAEDTNIFVTLYDKNTQQMLGVIQFIVTPKFHKGSVKAALYGVIAQNRGLEKILMCSIFKLLPDTQRIFLHTRSTNEKAILTYKEWGFTQFTGKLPNWTDLEYLVENSDNLQKSSDILATTNSL